MNVLLCPFSDPGYLYPALAVGIELRRRGHRVLVLARPRAAVVIGEAGLPMLDAREYHGGRAFSVGCWGETGAAQYRAVAAAAREIGADVLVTSALCHGALLAAEALDLPAVVLGFAAHLWPYRHGGEGEPEHVVLREWRLRELLRHYHATRERVGLRARRDRRPDLPLIGAGLLLRGDPALEYPGAVLPEGIHHVGPCAWEPGADPAELRRLTERLARIGKPVVYVHLGRTFGGESLWPRLNATFTGGPFQAVVERARSGEPRAAAGADLIVVERPWMGPLIALAEVVLTNGTSSPVLAALGQGRPLAVAPAGSEQPLLAEACVRSGVAVRFPGPGGEGGMGGVAGGGAGDGAGLLKAVCDDEPLKQRARRLGERLNRSGGAGAAADFVTSVVSRNPVGAREG
ncbi:glycosyltransferase [Sphaerimonospora mesophila]|uniref:glycosyltransferase n=1 Tax=Sphaerimonospora mesophila TaxID=37483 RepID=UPI0006E408D0